MSFGFYKIDATGPSLSQSDFKSNQTPATILANNRDARQYTSYKDIGGMRDGIYSGLDRKIIDREVQRQQNVMGDGFTRLAMLDMDGRVVKDSAFNIGGTAYYPSEIDGTLTIVDSALVKKALDLNNQRKEKMRKITEHVASSDEVACMILGVTNEDLMKNLGPGGAEGRGNAWAGDLITSNNELYNVNAIPSYMQYLDKNSLEYSRACQKLNIAVMRRKPVYDPEEIGDSTTKEVLNADA